MKHSRLSFAAAVALFSLATAHAQDAKKDQASLQGAWEVTAFLLDGNAPKDAKQVKFVIAGDMMTVTGTDGDRKLMFKFKLDPAKTPKTIDLMPLEGDFVGKTAPGIYHLEKDVLKLCVPNRGEERPKQFDVPKDSGLALFVMKRAK